MKSKFLTVLLGAALVLGLSACGQAAKTAPAAQGAVKGAEHKVLVAYFSCSGNTRKAATAVASSVGGTLYEITPSTAYSEADLNYRDETSRCSREHADSKLLPELKGTVADFAKYDVVYLGYPIWWGVAPNIIHSFIKAHKWEGKVVVPFATSYSSDFGKSGEILASSAKGAKFLPGRVFKFGFTDAAVTEWVRELKGLRGLRGEG